MHLNMFTEGHRWFTSQKLYHKHINHPEKDTCFSDIKRQSLYYSELRIF